MDFDYIIIGGGSAGCVLAARLSEMPDARILLLEAGGRDRHPFYAIPAGFAKMTKGIGSWGWSTVPQTHLGNRVLTYTQARVIGGGSSINAQIYTRGTAADYDRWANQEGCPGWTYRDVLPYFRKSERNSRGADEFHGADGPMGVSDPAAPLPICDAFLSAAEEYGLPRNPDLAGGSQFGVGYYQLTQREARRASTASAFLRPALRRANLKVRMNCRVARILVTDGRATGVEITEGGQRHQLKARREVILSAGAIGSPKLLMQSGIGPGAHLAELGIEVVHDNGSVGANLQDHLDLFTIWECTGPHTYDTYASPFRAALAGLRYLLTRTGPAASSLFETGGFAPLAEGDTEPGIQFHLGLGSGIEAGVEKLRNAGVTLNSAVTRPFSRGTVRLSAPDPGAPPLIDPNYWSDPRDRDNALRGLRMARAIMGQPALAPYVAREVLPGCGVGTDAALIDYACRTAKTDHHPVGTCRMGSDEAAVVDLQLRFKGIDGLRICDASVMPSLISSNTNAATIMIAERCADFIKSPDR